MARAGSLPIDVAAIPAEALNCTDQDLWDAVRSFCEVFGPSVPSNPQSEQEVAILTIIMCIKIPGCASAMATSAPSDAPSLAFAEPTYKPTTIVPRNPTTFMPDGLRQASWKKALWWLII